jgi:cytochrome c oxidase accessory protein FixG
MIDARPVEGRFRRLRWGADALLIAILLVIPWVRIGGEPLVLLDIPARKFHVFGIVIFPQELFFLWLIVAMAALSLFFFTALLGRLWCGWACPQTVFTDVFAAIGRFVQGWRGHRPPARVAAWRTVATHVVWFALCAVVGFHLVGYFTSPYVLLGQLRTGDVTPTTAGFVAFATFLSYADFVWVKQTFCRYLCPYARFQGVLFDRDTLVIGYDAGRGDPRGKRGQAAGDCVDCGLCVSVCPTEIDIRDGMQLECIACTQCIDACDGVMERLGRARNLIGYRSLVSLEGRREARILRPRVVIYALLLVAAAAGFIGMLGSRLPMDMQLIRNAQALYTTTADGRIGNAFTLHIENRDRQERSYHIGLEDGTGLELVTGINPVTVPAISELQARVFVLADADGQASPRDIHIVLQEVGSESRRIVRHARFLSPGGGDSRGG